MLAALKSLPENSVYTSFGSPVGALGLVASDDGLHAVLWEDDLSDLQYRRVLSKLKRDPRHSVLSEAEFQLKEYFAGERKAFDLPLVMAGTEFQKSAWLQLRGIPYGQTISYAEQARRMGDVKKARAVGSANGLNPISIIVPCHRVIATSGSLSGFGGGIHNKRFLLELEQQA